ncbi:hypothetical protein M2156_001392 [Streptomyces sp. SAI-149]|nr:hypothetical protein [Streptomyces sp. SAI-119]MDH6495173.1 hypothetical protein [Streptomyces sp. SAI-149]
MTDKNHHVLDAGVVVEAVAGQVLAVAGGSEPAVRHLGDERKVGVGPHAPEVRVAAEAVGGAVVPRPNAGGEAQATPFAIATASASCWNDWTVRTGPKTSSWTMRSDCRTPVITVGAKKKSRVPTWVPPARTSAWDGRASMYDATLAKCRAAAPRRPTAVGWSSTPDPASAAPFVCCYRTGSLPYSWTASTCRDRRSSTGEAQHRTTGTKYHGRRASSEGALRAAALPGRRALIASGDDWRERSGADTGERQRLVDVSCAPRAVRHPGRSAAMGMLGWFL